MIAYLSGKLLEKEATRLKVDVSPLGYGVFIPTNTLAESDNIGNSLSLNIATIVREDAFLLYGFKTKEEKRLFNLLISVNKIGPKTAIGIMSAVAPSDLQNIIVSNNQHALSKLPGIGPKGAAKLILELKDKITQIGVTHSSNSNLTVINEAISALTSLGFSNQLSQKSVNSAYKEINNPSVKVEDLIRVSLKHAQK